jgi:dephospho-CoA kinase
MLINLRGTNGSGKTTAVNALLHRANARAIYGVLGASHPEAYRVRLPGVEQDAFIIGPYDCPTGGCDRIQPFELIEPLIVNYAAQGHVIFEGLLIACCYGTIGKLLERRGRDALILFLDTPVELCIERVNARRLERGDVREFDSAHLIQKHATIARLKQKIDATGTIRTALVSSTNAASAIIKCLAKRTWLTKI